MTFNLADIDKYSIKDDHKAVAEFLEPSYVINLDSAEDRLRHVQEQFAKFGLSFQRFPAVFGEDYLKEVRKVPEQHPQYKEWSEIGISVEGTIGCRQSHASVIATAKRLNLSHVCVWEDDLLFTDDFLFVMARVLESLPEDWEALTLGGMYNNAKKRHINDWLSVIEGQGTWSSHAYIVRAPLYDDLLKVWNPWSASSLDVEWQPLQRERNWYFSRYWIARQIYMHSTIRGKTYGSSLRRKPWHFD